MLTVETKPLFVFRLFSDVRIQRKVILISGLWLLLSLMANDYYKLEHNQHRILNLLIIFSTTLAIIGLLTEKWQNLLPFSIFQMFLYFEYSRVQIIPMLSNLMEMLSENDYEFRHAFKIYLLLACSIFAILFLIYAMFCTWSVIFYFYTMESSANLNTSENPEDSNVWSTISLLWNGKSTQESPNSATSRNIKYTVNPNFENSNIYKPYA
ncbi:unnamed protein product [Caenorhabditis angaria]|uniref:Uncharacterized protein n=1 Tax=Caenorhabditis angaria TaxID=860376 RepID=A0A9P1IPT6_9PELO|nr:unnamed protein product [Caenorhabditis angaria]